MTDLVESTRQYLNETPDDGEQEILNEFISLRTGLIGAGLAKTKQYRSEEHTSELQSRRNLVCRLLLEKKK